MVSATEIDGADLTVKTRGRNLRDLFDFREHHVGGRGIVLVLVGADLAAAIPGEAEILAHLVDTVQFAGRNVVTHAVDLIVVGPERLVLWIEIHADGVP